LSGTGVNNTGALHSISGINQWVGNITLGGLGAADAGIGVDSEEDNGQPSSLTDQYFTNDYSLTVSGDIAGIRSTTFHKEGHGQLILPNSNTYVGDTIIEQGWITIQNSLSLGQYIPGSDTVQPTTTVLAGAALHLRPMTPGA